MEEKSDQTSEIIIARMLPTEMRPIIIIFCKIEEQIESKPKAKTGEKSRLPKRSHLMPEKR